MHINIDVMPLHHAALKNSKTVLIVYHAESLA